MADRKDELIPEERMKDMAVAPGEPKNDKADEAEDAARDEENLEEGLEDSMDGSDPPSSLQP
ncbi:hypothetical protein [Novosphingopyxis sp.]|uniref:hypothetical protein n=1 Tax=Novosphingopyxis sp. TaxID=2709690 RepID=UPI003B5B3F96